ncbi:MAG: bifunctional 3,4-dihydroxy-2-butanone-4-phosphate synthase/GTP cyclohydrolase II [Thermoanaerobaculia bacterium]|nr:bifunctional 3,4-dihydroxy-2-butanone-4-phosphate synthase/GTP cyclohydrolase II [Thermoanaerobaculia bacterium]
MRLASVEEGVAAFRAGRFVVVVDDESRENEGDLILSAEGATPEKLGFMVRHTSGILCLPLLEERLRELSIPMMVSQNTDARKTAFTVSVDYRHGTTTGISAADRAATVLAAIDPESAPTDFSRPGHIFPLRYQRGGVLSRPGHTEATIDLARLAGCYPGGVLAELVNDDGSMKRLPALLDFAAEHDLPVITIADLIRHRFRNERLVRRRGVARLPTEFGEFRAIGYESTWDGLQHLALVAGDVAGRDRILVRVHSECLTGDVFSSLRCDCGFQLRDAMASLGREGTGVLLYLRGHEGRGIGLLHKIAAYELQDRGRDTVQANEDLGLPADARNYGVSAQILQDLEVRSIRLLTNNPVKRSEIERFGIEISERLPLLVEPNDENRRYLRTKELKLGHRLGLGKG